MKTAAKTAAILAVGSAFGILANAPARATVSFPFGPFTAAQFNSLTANGGTVDFFAPNSVALTGPVSITSSPNTTGTFTFDYTSVGSGSSFFNMTNTSLPAESTPTPLTFTVQPGSSFGFQVFGPGDSLTITNFASAAPEASSFAAVSLAMIGLGALMIRARRRAAQSA